MRNFLALFAILFSGCGFLPGSLPSTNPVGSHSGKSLAEARQGFTTRITRTDPPAGPPDAPVGDFELIQYTSAVGKLPAYVTKDPGGNMKRPAIVWITGGDCNSIGEVWMPQPRENDQTASAFRKAGMVMMFPSLRGGNNNPGQREGGYGEVDDVVAAADHLATLPYVDPQQIYLGGHSTGGTLVMLVGAFTDRFKAVFALGPVASPLQYGGQFTYCDLSDNMEMALRTPLYWLGSVKKPMYVFEGGQGGNWDAIQQMASVNTNNQVQFFQVPGHDHFSVIAPLTDKLAEQAKSGQLNVTQQMVQGLR